MKAKKILSVVLTLSIMISLFTGISLPAKADPAPTADFIITNDGGAFALSNCSSAATTSGLTFSDAVSGCSDGNGDGTTVIQFGGAGTPLSIYEVTDGSNTYSLNMSATYIGAITVSDDAAVSAGAAIIIPAGVTATFLDLEMSSAIGNSNLFKLLSVKNGGALNITGNTALTVFGEKSYGIANDGTVNVSGSGSTISASGSYSYVVYNNNIFNMSAGTISSSGSYTVCLYNVTSCTAAISGGTISNSGSYYAIYNSGTVTISEADHLVPTYISSNKTPVNNISSSSLTVTGGTIEATGTTGYAVSAANSSVSFEGCSLKASNTSGSASANVIRASEATVTIGDNTAIECSGTGINSYAVYIEGGSSVSISGTHTSITSGYRAIYDSGTVTSGNGSLYIKEASISAANDSIYKHGEGKTTIESGTFTSSSANGINHQGGTLNISGGTISGAQSGALSQLSGTLSGTLSISGGEVKCTGTSGPAVYIWPYTLNGTSVTASVSGSAVLSSVSARTISFSKLNTNYTHTGSLSLFGKTIHNSTGGAISITGKTDPGDSLKKISSADYTDAVVTASGIDGNMDFVGWASDSALASLISATNGDSISNLTSGANASVTDIYLKVRPKTVILAPGSLGTAGDCTITGLTSGKAYKVTSGSNVYYVQSDGTLTSEASLCGALVGTSITGLLNGTTYLVEEYTAAVSLASGSLGTAGDKTVTGLDSGRVYKVTSGSDTYYVMADGTLTANAADAAPLIGTAITGLTNGTTYNVQLCTSFVVSGRVYANTTGASVGGITVTLYSSGAPTSYSDTTDVKGFFEITEVPNGTYLAVVAAHAGSYMLSESGQFTVAGANVTAGADVVLQPEAPAAWDGSVSASLSGSGISSDPFLIASGSDLAYMAQQVNAGASIGGVPASSACYKLSADIVLNQNASDYENWGSSAPSNSWTPIGNSTSRFTGVFDGDGYKVSGIYIKNSSSFQGLFGFIEGATVKNVGVTDSYIEGDFYTAAVVGSNSGTIENCYNTGVINGTAYVGGVAGDNRTGAIIRNCYNSGSVSGGYNIGGVIGAVPGGTAENCRNTGSVSSTDVYVGGVTGSMSGTMQYCYNMGRVSGGSNSVGGVVGYSGGTMRYCYNAGGISGVKYVGGVAGSFVDGSISACYNAGEVSGTRLVGGVVGNMDNNITLSECYSAGGVSGGSNIGGIAGGSSGTVTGCYYDKQMCAAGGINGSDSDGAAVGKLTTEMLGNPAFSGWDSGKWTFSSDFYPRLTGIESTDAAYVSAAPIRLSQTEKASSVSSAFTVCTTNSVYWTSSDTSVISLSGGSAAVISGGGVTLTASLNGVSKAVALTAVCATYSISGTVLPGTTGAPVGGLTVKLYASTDTAYSNVLYTATTAQDGSYTITGVPNGSYVAVIGASAGNGQSVSGTIVVSGGNVTAGAGITLAAVQPDYTVTGGPSSFQVDGAGAYTTLASALAACTNSGADGKLTIQLGSETNPLRVSERNFSSNNAANTLIPATYLGNVEILDDAAINDGVGLVTGGAVIFDAVKISATIENPTSFSAVYVKYGKSLTVNGGTFTVSGANSRCLTSEAVLTINDGTFTGSGTGFICIDNQNTDSGTGTLTINGGAFHVEGSNGIIISNAGKMTVAGGSFSAGNGTPQDTVCIMNSASASSDSSVSGGTFTSTDSRGVGIQNTGYLTVSGSTSIIIPFQTIRMDGGTLIISGGTVTADAANGIALAKTGSGQVTISGGSISGKAGAIANVGAGTINITGGSLSSEGTAVNSSDGTIDISGGSVSCSGNMSAITIQSSLGNSSLTLSGAAKLTSANGVAVSIMKVSGTNTLSASLFGKTIHGSGLALIRVISGRGVEMNSTSVSNCALLASEMSGSSFDAWTPDASLQNASSTINGEILLNLAADIYLRTGSAASLYLASGSLGTAGNGTISGLTSGKAYKVTMGGITLYSTAAGYLAFDPAYSAPLTGTELIGLVNGSTYFVEEISTAVVLASGSLGTAGNGRITGLTSGTRYKVTVGSAVYYVKADGTLSASASDAAALTGTEITGLTNGTSYLVEVYSTGGSSSGPSAPAADTGAKVEVGGQTQTAGTVTTTTSASGTTTTVTMTSRDIENVLNNAARGSTITVPITTGADTAVGRLDGQAVKNMENKEATLVIRTDSATYTLPASEINIDAVSAKFGENVSLGSISVDVSISEPPASTVRVVENAANDGGFAIMVPAVEFTVRCTYNGQTVDVSAFNSYVERMVAIPDGVDPSKITTGIVVEPNGSVRHVPTEVVVIGGKYYAKINSLTNSVYSVIYNPVEFTDAENHWAKSSINNMGSRMVVNGVGDNKYDPDRSITRAEFAAIMVKALGLEPGIGSNGFGDVDASSWYCKYVKTASSYGIIKGYDDKTFGPNDLITREQAMTMVARAMKITGLDVNLSEGDVSGLLGAYTDAATVSDYAKSGIASCIKAGVVTGKTASTVAPKYYITRAEVAVMAERLLQKSKLI